MRRVAFLMVLCVAPGCWRPVPPGPGDPSSASQARLKRDAENAKRAAVKQACQTADARPSDERMQFKAAELTADLLTHADQKEKSPLLATAQPTLDRLTKIVPVCGSYPVAARVYDAAEKWGTAASLYARAGRECRDYASVLAAALAFEHDHHCTDAVNLISEMWSGAPQEHWIPLFDAVASCSDAVSLRQNLSFLPAAVLGDYLALVQRRHEEWERQQREAAAEAAANQAESVREASRSRCESYCNQAYSQCASSCAGASGCPARCGARQSTCLAGCQ